MTQNQTVTSGTLLSRVRLRVLCRGVIVMPRTNGARP
jgi:hypothetical protein